jgi:hypothetical protein
MAMSFLSAIGKDFKAVFSFLGSPVGKAVVGVVETGVEAAVPATTRVFNLVNNWMSEIIKVETLATAASQQTGSGAIKAAAVINSLTPEILQFAKTNGYPIPGAAQIAIINTALVTVLNTLGSTTTPVTPSTTAVDGGVPVGN